MGYESSLIVKDVRTQDPKIIRYPSKKTEKTWAKISRRVVKREWSKVDLDINRYYYGIYEQFSTVSAKTILALMPNKPDVIFIHWVNSFINTKLVNELHQLTGALIVWLMLDNAPITGGCHFPWDCKNFAITCDACPAILNPDKKWKARENLAFKKKYITPKATICVFSQNDYERAEASVLFRDKRIVKLPGYFVDEKKFCPGDKKSAKSEFSIPSENRVLFFGATSLEDKRKGMHLFLEALALVNQEKITLLVAGSTILPLNFPNMKLVGNLNEELLIKAYQAADMFICPTLEDSGPTMTNQAIMCGTPVVAFETGLGRDLVHTGKTGYRAIYGDARDLARGIEFMMSLSPEEAIIIAQNCRNLALELYGGVEVYKKELASLIDNC